MWINDRRQSAFVSPPYVDSLISLSTSRSLSHSLPPCISLSLTLRLCPSLSLQLSLSQSVRCDDVSSDVASCYGRSCVAVSSEPTG